MSIVTSFVFSWIASAMNSQSYAKQSLSRTNPRTASESTSYSVSASKLSASLRRLQACVRELGPGSQTLFSQVLLTCDQVSASSARPCSPSTAVKLPASAIPQRTWRKIRQNLFWAFAYNVVGIPLAAFGLLNPVIAGAAMALSSVSVVSNALLLRRWRPARR